ncbi:sulfurtransferase TusA family protein [Candidatus Binatia bacterium]|jgi:TusA-related sulfurtransferase|nr:sulfurtransferase TusA family protein [Candidatus Binatia bacterium]
MSTSILDVRGTKCPVPIVKAKQALDKLAAGDVLEVHATDGGSVEDFKGWAATSRLATLDAQRVEQDGTGATVYVHVLTRKP